MKIYLATDHAGFELKEKIKAYLLEKGENVEDCGALSFNKDDDYPDFISLAAQKVSQSPQERGIIFGGSGQAEAMLANKYKGVRCALFYAPVAPVGEADVSGRKSTDPYEMIRLTREHNNANMLSLGSRFLTEDQVKKAIDAWLATGFDETSRHGRRVEKMTSIENAMSS